MRILNTKNISFNPITGELRINALGLPLQATISQKELHKSSWSVPSLTSRLIEPLVLTVAASWSFIETNEELEIVQSQERELHEIMAQAFWWATSDINCIQGVRLVSTQDLRRLSATNHAHDLSSNVTFELQA